MTRRGRAVARVVATVLLVAGGACIGTSIGAAAADDQRASATSAASHRTAAAPLLSPRRLPALFDDIVAAQQLQSSVDVAFASWDACVAIDFQGRALARRTSDKPLAPASTQKLVTSAAALAVFGPDHRFVTDVVTVAAVRQGIVRGDVYVVGGGDPMLATPAFEAQLRARALTSAEPVTPLASLADAIVAAGVRRIDGALLGDDSRHDSLRFLPVWKPSYRTDGEIGALSALGVDHGFSPVGSAVAPDDPAAVTAARLVELLAQRGVTVTGGSGSATVPAAQGARELTSVSSPPLADIVAATLTASDNYAAETLMREIGVEHAQASTTEAGAAAVVDVLQQEGVTMRGVTLLDGSGLAPGNRLTCDALLGVMDLASRPEFAALDRGLAVAGQTGTLARRFLGDALQGVLRAKTGHIDGVAGLVGVVDDTEHLRFAFLVNGQVSRSQGEALQATVARVVAAYPQPPDGARVPPP